MEMTVFKYSAMDSQGREHDGTVEAAGENDANAKLREKGLYPTSISEDRRGRRRDGGVHDKGEKEKTLAAWVVLLLVLLVLSLAANAMAATMWLFR